MQNVVPWIRDTSALRKMATNLLQNNTASAIGSEDGMTRQPPNLPLRLMVVMVLR